MIQNTIDAMPNTFGVYQMINDKGQILYIGKSKHLKTRVRSYFYDRAHSEKIETMVHHIHDIQWIETDTHLDACLLECQLIKEIRPIYNRQFKSDRTLVTLTIEAPGKLSLRPFEAGDQFIVPKSRRLMNLVDDLKNYYPITFDGDEFNFKRWILNPRLSPQAWDENRKSLQCILESRDHLKLFQENLTHVMKLEARELHFERAGEIKALIEGLEYLDYWLFELPAFLNDSFTVRLPAVDGEKTYFISKGQIIKTIYQGTKNQFIPDYPQGLHQKSLDFLQIVYREVRDLK